MLEAERVQTLEDLNEFIKTRANQMLLTPPRPMKVYEPEADLASLFGKLVGGPHYLTEQAAIVKRDLRETLSKMLEERGVSERVERNVRVDLPLLQREVVFPFRFRNGRPNLVQTAAFEGEIKQNIDRASVLGFEGIALAEKPERPKLHVFGTFKPDDRETLDHVRRMFEKVDVALHTDEEVREFVEFIKRTAH